MGPTTSIGGGGKFGGGGYTKSGRSFREMEEEEKNKRRLEERMNPLMGVQRRSLEKNIQEAEQRTKLEEARQREFFTSPSAQMSAATGRPLTKRDYEDMQLRKMGPVPSQREMAAAQNREMERGAYRLYS